VCIESDGSAAHARDLVGVLCFGLLHVRGPVENLARAKASHAEQVIQSALVANEQDGQLQWRGKMLLAQMHSLRRMSVIERVQEEAEKQVCLRRVRRVKFPSQLRDVAASCLPLATHRALFSALLRPSL
jgi:hypothetical protein